MKLLTNFILIAVVLCFTGFNLKTNQNQNPIVKTTFGSISGSIDDGIFTFKGIPYAKAERFMPPQDPDAWDGILECKDFGPVAKQIVPWYPDSIQNGKKVEQIDAAAVLEGANQGDQFSIELLERTGKHLGTGIAILINVFNPDLIIFRGGVANAAPYLLDTITISALKQSMIHVNKNVRFITSKLGHKAGALGVAMLAAKDLFEVEHLNPAAYV